MIRRSLLLSAAAVLTLAACGQGAGKKAGGEGAPLLVGATAVPHAEILEQVKPILAAEGVPIEIKVFNDYVQPNVQLAEKRLDVNYFQTKPYLDEFNAARGTTLITVAGIHVEPLGLYSRKHKTLAELPNGAQVVLPNDASNTGRALLLLQAASLITLKDPQNPLQTVRDIAVNPKGLKFQEVEAATIPRILPQVDGAVINTNYALDAGLKPKTDALQLEGADSPYVNYLVARPDNQDDPRVQALAKALRGQAIKDFIASKYEGAVIPAA
ncbi:MAG: MetQ/NlpA family ABC transporter substrate-binding protein [Brevundimonas sp.]|jgi:D-methionine transport system substrate-binding protein|uniref:MetQ/NlpA family ABC transporter substrate-binding protein n=1 Tax=Brevundimonas sp. TaxID=1871086 RepID=UPI0025BCC02E|nr:MetQ/NlpA family ABC transporter substrate-binding protein [Brevundimonas sp.]MCH4267123.1 MetQ/NlpA family ABC transporter substrate-binding protein [Brevundimonas sp.]